jgi:acid phosphatase class B
MVTKARYAPKITLAIALSLTSSWNNVSAYGCLDVLWACLFSDTPDIAHYPDDDDDDNDDDTNTQPAPMAANALADSVAITILSPAPQSIERQHHEQKLADTSRVIITNLEGHFFFTTPPPCKTLRGEDEKTFTALSLEKLEDDRVRSWYANRCSNTSLSKLIDVTINYIEICEKDIKKAALAKPNVVIFDIDDTIFSSYQAECYIAKNSMSLSAKQIDEKHITDVTDIAPVHRLYTYFQDKRYCIVFVSGRTEGTRDETKALLQKNGYIVNDENLFLRGEPSDDVADFKARIREKLAVYYTVFAIVDDDYNNLCGTNMGRYNIWIPNIFTAQVDEAKFYTYLAEHPFRSDNQSHAKAS